MTIDILIARARARSNEPSNKGHVTDTELVDAFNEVQNQISTLILESDEAYYEAQDTSIGWVNGTEEYDLPRPIAARKITKVTRTDLSSPVDLWPIRFQKKNEYETAPGSNIAPDGQSYYYLRGEKIGFKPTPRKTAAGNIQINYQQLPHEVHWAHAKTPATTYLIIPTATSGAAPIIKAGRILIETDYYAGARIRFLTGNSAGLEVVVSAYDPALRKLTFTTTLSAGQVTDITNAEYVIVSPHPKEYQDAGMWGMVKALATKNKNGGLRDSAQLEINAVLNKVRENVTPRTMDFARYIQPPADFDY